MKVVAILLGCFTLSSSFLHAQHCSEHLLSKCKAVSIFFANKEYAFTLQNSNKGVSLTTNLPNGSNLVLYNACINDTLFMTREDLLIDESKGMYMIYGVQAIPNQLKVGDKLPYFKNALISAPITKEDFQQVTTVKSNFEYGGQYASSYVVSVIRTFNLKTTSTITQGADYLDYVNAKVVAEENLILSGNTYKAYKIEYELWTKINMNVQLNYQSNGTSNYDRKEIEKQEKKTNEMLAKKFDKLSKEGTNSEGYLVTPKTDWFIPGIGIVKSYTYNTGRMFEKDKAYYTNLKF